MLAIAGQTAGPNWLNFFLKKPIGTREIKIRLFLKIPWAGHYLLTYDCHIHGREVWTLGVYTLLYLNIIHLKGRKLKA